MRYNRESDFYRVEIVNPEDLWYLSLILRNGDLIKAEVLRRTENREDMIRSKKREREKVTVTLKIESIEFSELQMRIHVLGEIVSGPEDYIGEHQSVNVETGSSILMMPSDVPSFLKTMEEATSLSYARINVISVDEKGVSCYLVDESTNELIWRVQTSQGKMFVDQKSGGSNELRSRLEKLKGEKVYIVGPQVLREKVIRLLNELRVTAESTDAGESDEEGIKLLLSSGLVDMRRASEMKFVNSFLKGINSGLAAYGREMVLNALEAGAVETVIIADRYFRENNSFQILERCTSKGCRVFIVHSAWETGKIVNSYGGIVGILRYRINDLLPP
ncbi:MAG: hypothetical protein QXN66_01425 [Thermoplasmatales archaeon]